MKEIAHLAQYSSGVRKTKIVHLWVEQLLRRMQELIYRNYIANHLLHMWSVGLSELKANFFTF